jgi:hypothetical protein
MALILSAFFFLKKTLVNRFYFYSEIQSAGAMMEGTEPVLPTATELIAIMLYHLAEELAQLGSQRKGGETSMSVQLIH